MIRPVFTKEGDIQATPEGIISPTHARKLEVAQLVETERLRSRNEWLERENQDLSRRQRGMPQR